MAAFRIGEKVMRTWDERIGVVRDIENNWFRDDSFLVRWYDGGEEWVQESELVPA